MFSHETKLSFMYKVFIVLFEKENQVKSSGAWLEGEFNDDGPKQKVHSVRSAVEINLQPTVLMKTTCRQGNRWRFLPSDTHQLLFLLPLQGFWEGWLGVVGRTLCSCLLNHRCGTTWTRSPFRTLALADQLLEFWFCVCGCLPIHLCSFGVAIFSMESFGVLFSIA